MKFLSIFFLTLFLSINFSGLYAADAKNIIIMIGDGFGPGMYSFVKYYAQFMENRPVMNYEKVRGFIDNTQIHDIMAEAIR